VVGKSETANPLFSPSNPVDQDIVRLIYSGILRRDTDGSLKPDLAKSYSISPDQTTYTITLQRDLKWQDGVVITSRDVAFTIGLIQSTDYSGPLSAKWANVKVEIKDDQTILFKLPTPYAFFSDELTLPILPWHTLRDIPVKNLSIAAFNDHPIGSGPFAFESKQNFSDPGITGGEIQEIALKRNSYYYAKLPHLDHVVFRIYTNPHDALKAYERRAVDGVSGIGAGDANEASNWKGLKLYDKTLPQFSALFYNLDAKNAPTTDLRVRKALSELIDRKPLIKTTLSGQGFSAYYPLVSGERGYDPSLPRVTYDPKDAAALLDQAGWVKNPSTGNRLKGRAKLVVDLVTGSDDTYQKAANFIKDAWEKAGVAVNITESDPSQLAGKYVQPRNYQVLLYGISLGPSGDLYPFWHSSQIGASKLNLSNYTNGIVDRALEGARLTTNKDQVDQKYVRMQKTWMADLPAQPLFTPIYEIGIDRKVHGVSIGRLDVPSDRFASIADWYIKAKKEY
jgi:peptide/nickel transport system substrate-binding protein